MSAPIEIPADAVAMFRLPLTIQRLSEICEMFSGEGSTIAQIGDWVVVEKPKEGRP